VLGFVDKALHQAALAVELCIVFRRLPAGRNDGNCAPLEYGLAKVIGIIVFVCNDILTSEARNQVFCPGNVMPLAACQAEAQGVSKRIYRDMELGAEGAWASCPPPACSTTLTRAANTPVT